MALIDAGLVGSPNGKHFMDGLRLSEIMKDTFRLPYYTIYNILGDLENNGTIAFKAIKFLSEIDPKMSLQDLNSAWVASRDTVRLRSVAATLLAKSFDRLFDLPDVPFPIFKNRRQLISEATELEPLQISTLAHHVKKFAIMNNHRTPGAILYLNSEPLPHSCLCGVIGTYIFEINRMEESPNKLYISDWVLDSLIRLGFVIQEHTIVGNRNDNSWLMYLPTLRSNGLYICIGQHIIPNVGTHPNLDI